MKDNENAPQEEKKDCAYGCVKGHCDSFDAKYNEANCKYLRTAQEESTSKEVLNGDKNLRGSIKVLMGENGPIDPAKMKEYYDSRIKELEAQVDSLQKENKKLINDVAEMTERLL